MKNVIEEIAQAIGPDKFLSADQISERFDHVWNTEKPLLAKAVILATKTEDVSQVLKICNAADQPVVMHGGLTNLVGSTRCKAEDIILSLEKMNSILEVDEQSRTMTVEAGCILETIQQAAARRNLLFPLNFGAKGSAQIGGCVATNAGGLRVLRYGMTRNLILGMEAVLADGTILSSLKKIIKNNSGYDLKHLLIGSEGTLGIVTKLVLKLEEAPQSRNSAFVGFDDFNKLIAFLKFADNRLGGTLSAFELLWHETYKALTTEPSQMKPPLPYDFKYYVLFESLGGNVIKDNALFMEVLVSAMEKELILDAAPAHTQADQAWFWNIREDVGVINAVCIFDQHFDVSLPISKIDAYVDKILKEIVEIEGVDACYAFGHVADGNIHFIVDKMDDSDALRKAINAVVYPPLEGFNGSVSAEHGIGLDKKPYLSICRTQEEIATMRLIKNSLDPKGILNPGKIID